MDTRRFINNDIVIFTFALACIAGLLLLCTKAQEYSIKEKEKEQHQINHQP
jgi:hypothetical protein